MKVIEIALRFDSDDIDDQEILRLVQTALEAKFGNVQIDTSDQESFAQFGEDNKRHESYTLSDQQKVEANIKEIQRRVALMGDDCLPNHLRYYSEQKKNQFKAELVIVQMEEENGN